METKEEFIKNKAKNMNYTRKQRLLLIILALAPVVAPFVLMFLADTFILAFFVLFFSTVVFLFLMIINDFNKYF